MEEIQAKNMALEEQLKASQEERDELQKKIDMTAKDKKKPMQMLSQTMKMTGVPVMGNDGKYSLMASGVGVNKKSRIGQFQSRVGKSQTGGSSSDNGMQL